MREEGVGGGGGGVCGSNMWMRVGGGAGVGRGVPIGEGVDNGSLSGKELIGKGLKKRRWIVDRSKGDVGRARGVTTEGGGKVG